MEAMSEADTGYFRSLSIAGFFLVLCVMLIFAAILGPAKQTSFDPSKKDRGGRDLELGDLELESQRGGARGLGVEGQWDRGRPPPDEYDMFVNPWNNKFLDTLAVPEPAYLPALASSRGLDLADPDIYNIQTSHGDDPFADPDIYNIQTSHGDDPFADPTPEPGTTRPGLISFRTLTSLGPRFLQWKAQALGGGKEDEDQPQETEAAPAVTTADGDVPDLAALSAAAAPGARPTTQPFDPLPEWLITPKASAGPRDSRFFEVDVDGPAIDPPDHEFVAMQHELLMRVPIPARPGMARGSTWHPSRDPGEESFRPAVARNQTSAI